MGSIAYYLDLLTWIFLSPFAGIVVLFIFTKFVVLELDLIVRFCQAGFNYQTCCEQYAQDQIQEHKENLVEEKRRRLEHETKRKYYETLEGARQILAANDGKFRGRNGGRECIPYSLLALERQALEGNNMDPLPGCKFFSENKEYNIWIEWTKLRGISKSVAKRQFIGQVKNHYPEYYREYEPTDPGVLDLLKNLRVGRKNRKM